MNHLAKIYLDLATPQYLLHVPGNYVVIRTSSSAAANVNVQIEDSGRPVCNLTAGYGIKERRKWRLLIISWPAQAGEWVELGVDTVPSELVTP